MAKDLEEALVSPKAKLGSAEKPRMDLGAHLEYIESLLERGGGGSVDLVKSVFSVQKAPVPTTGYLEKFFFDRELKPEQVDSLIANANLTFIDLNGDGATMVYPILAADSTPNPKLFLILDESTLLGLASGSGAAWAIMEYIGETIYYVSPVLAVQEGFEAGWQKAAFASDDVNYVTIGANLLTDGPFGAQNDLLTELVYVGSLADSGETELVKSLTGQYKIVEKNIKLDTNENTAYSYDFINSINDDTKEISVIKNIEVDTGREDAVISRGITTYANDRILEIGHYAFAQCRQLEAVSFPNATYIGDYAFYHCDTLASVEIPLAERVGEHAFSECPELGTVTFTKAQRINSGTFYNDSNLREANLQEVGAIGEQAFYGCHRLVKVFINNTSCFLENTNAFGDCYHILGITAYPENPNGLKDGYIYVPAQELW